MSVAPTHALKGPRRFTAYYLANVHAARRFKFVWSSRGPIAGAGRCGAIDNQAEFGHLQTVSPAIQIARKRT
jgi:hypothetical protein